VVGVRLTRVPRRDWAHNLDAMARIAADIAYLVNPHNPTGTVRGRAEIEQFARAARPADRRRRGLRRVHRRP
jgi:histidinol-phosphate aminotransferase